jgi:hypothetical protein
MTSPPTCKAVVPFQMEDAECSKRCSYTSNAKGSPEEAETSGQLSRGVEVGKPENEIGNKSTL